MDGTFTLRIELGNEAMQTLINVADALHGVARRIAGDGEVEGRIRDLNGNTVGEFGVCTGAVGDDGVLRHDGDTCPMHEGG